MQLDRITQQSMGTGLTAITQATEPAEQAREIVNYASRYNLIRELAATVLNAGADRPVMQNILLDDNMTLEERGSQSTALDLVKLESRVERMFDKLDAKLDAAIVEMRHIRAEATSKQPIVLTSRAIVAIVVGMAALVTAQITLLAFLGALPHG